MKPLRLKMQAFGSYGKETVIDFEKVNQNLFLITGIQEQGKQRFLTRSCLHYMERQVPRQTKKKELFCRASMLIWQRSLLWN